MPKTAIVTLDDPKRHHVEAFIKRIYRLHYDASIEDFPALLIASADDRDNVVCAAGIRTAEDGFFSESYLDAPIERVLSDLSETMVDRGEVMEVSTLVSLAPAEISRFIARIISFGEEKKFSWSFFTATTRLRRMVETLGLLPICLADADHRRIANFERWGSYYKAEPRVFAVRSPRLAPIMSAVDGAGCRALSV